MYGLDEVMRLLICVLFLIERKEYIESSERSFNESYRVGLKVGINNPMILRNSNTTGNSL